LLYPTVDAAIVRNPIRPRKFDHRSRPLTAGSGPATLNMPLYERTAMKRLVPISAMLTLLAVLVSPTDAQHQMTRESLAQMSDHFRFFKILPDNSEGRMRYVYADEGPHLHAYHVGEDGRSVLDWETNVGSQIRSLVVTETRHGRPLIVIATAKGKLFAYDANTYNLDRENLTEPFTSLQAMAIAELDGDGAKEIILLGVREGEGAPHLFVYDAVSRSLEWRTQETFNASEILTANLDDDRQPEIILNTGTVIDSRFRTIEIDFVHDGGFGVRVRLLDINGDGFPEIFGSTLGEQLRVFDPYVGRRLW
jgi:hypothetical protein